MSQTIICLRYSPSWSPDESAQHLRALYHLNHESLPPAVLAEDDTALPWLGNSTLYRVCPLTADVVAAFLLRTQGDVLLLLPEDVFNTWQNVLLDGSHRKAIAFSLTLVPDTFSTNPSWVMQKNGNVILPEDPAGDARPHDDIHRILMKKEEKIEESLLHLFQAIDAEEAPHKIRVNARTLRSLLDFIKPWSDPVHNRNLRNLLRDLARTFSDIREQDVLMKQISAYHKTHPESLPHYDDLIAHIAEERRRHMNALLRETIRQNDFANIPELVQGLKAFTLTEDNLAHAINQRYYNLWLRFQLRADTHDYNDVEATHDLRKEAKRLRYVLENFAPWIPAVDAEMADHFKDIQTILGELCDVRVNQERLQALNTGDDAPHDGDRHTLIVHNRQRERDILKDLGVEPPGTTAEATRESKANTTSKPSLPEKNESPEETTQNPDAAHPPGEILPTEP